MSQVNPPKKKGVVEVGSEGETIDQEDVVPDHGAENGIITDADHVTDLGPIPDPDHQVREQDVGDHRSGINQRDFHSRWSHKSTMEKCPA